MSERKKVCCLGMPSYGELTSGAARGFFRAGRGEAADLRLLQQESSLLAHNMNLLWCWALNEARAGRCDYFAMLHADVEPNELWLDALITELEAKDLDVLGVAVPIKDARGVTSIALARDDGSTWRPHCRLTMAEIHRLPETFTSADVGRPLLLNTGCWVCRFDEAWAKNVRFTISDRIVQAADGSYRAEVEPEDWYFSRLLHELGLRVGCTRKVALTHRGAAAFTNERPWGLNEFDREYVAASVLDARPTRPEEPSHARSNVP